MRLVLVQSIALVLTLVAWGSDVLHVMHLGADETLTEHHASTGNEEPDAPRNDGLSDEPAITTELLDWVAVNPRGPRISVKTAVLDGDDHSRDLMRPPRSAHSA